MLKYTIRFTDGEIITVDEVLNLKDRVEYFVNGKWHNAPWHYICLDTPEIKAVKELRGIKVEDTYV